jgi:hypothetical protein
MTADAVPDTLWRLVAADVYNGNGVATVTLRSGVQFTGRVNRELSKQEVLQLSLPGGGWVSIDWTEIAAFVGMP